MNETNETHNPIVNDLMSDLEGTKHRSYLGELEKALNSLDIKTLAPQDIINLSDLIAERSLKASDNYRAADESKEQRNALLILIKVLAQSRETADLEAETNAKKAAAQTKEALMNASHSGQRLQRKRPKSNNSK